MSTLGLLTLVPAGISGILAIALLAKPLVFRQWLVRFPRDLWSGRVLAVIAVFWAAWILRDLPFGRFEGFKVSLWPAALLLGAGVCIYMDELLAPRALGALLLLFPAPLLDAARWHPSGWSVVMSFVAYVLVVKGMFLLLSPYWLRIFTERCLATDRNCRRWGSVSLIAASGMLVLAIFIY
jgi:uncharacterized protein YjeT (DUF2065 family)